MEFEEKNALKVLNREIDIDDRSVSKSASDKRTGTWHMMSSKETNTVVHLVQYRTMNNEIVQ